MTYLEQLESLEWKRKRTAILERDNFTCTNCNNTKIVPEPYYGVVLSPNPIIVIGDIFFRNMSHLFLKEPNIYSPFYLSVEMQNDFLRKNIRNIYVEYTIDNLKLIPLVIKHISSREIPYFRNYSYYPKPRVINSYEDHAELEHITKYSFYGYSNIEEYLTFDEEPIFFGKIKVNPYYNKSLVIKNKTYRTLFTYKLEVHHKRYIQGALAWEYQDKYLTTLCHICHGEVHKNTTIEVFSESLEFLGEFKRCHRCLGLGVLPQFYYYKKGICFNCDGGKIEPLHDS